MNKKNIVIISGVFYPEPVTSAVMNYDLANKLAEQYDVTVITPKPSRPMGYDFSNSKKAEGNFKQIIVDSFVHPKSSIVGRFRESYSFGMKAVDYIKAHHNEIDFVYNDGWQFVSLYQVARACVRYNIPYIVPIQDIYPESVLTKLPKVTILQRLVKSVMAPYDKYYISKAAKVRTISNGMAKYLSETRDVSLEQFLVVANWQDDSTFLNYKSEEPLDDGKIKFMFAGNNSTQANVDLIINAFIDAQLKNAELYIMGGGNAKEYCMRIAKDQGGKNVFFGTIPDGKVPEVQSKADVMVLALKTGTGKLGIPSKLVAYMLSGKPVIASVELDSDTAAIIGGSNSGVVVPPDDLHCLKDAFLKYADLSLEELIQQGKNSRRYAKEELSRDSNLQKVVDTTESIINSKRNNK